jgi:hypothetical protein
MQTFTLGGDINANMRYQFKIKFSDMLSFNYLLMSAIVVSALSVGNASTNTNTLCIYLVEGKLPAEKLRSTLLLKDLKLSRSPVIADQDFVFYDTTNHVFGIKPEAAKELSRHLMPNGNPQASLKGGELMYHFDGPPMAFAMFAFGQPVCVGIFSNPASSFRYSGPTVWPQSPVLPVNSTNTFNFLINREDRPETGRESDIPNEQIILRAIKALDLGRRAI